MPHGLIVGVTMSGKTTLAKMLASGLVKRGHKVAVLDPLRDPEWHAHYSTHDSAAFLRFAKRHKNFYLFIDEGGSAIGKYNAEMDWLTTTGRHLGHSVTIICHRVQQLSVNLRSNCNKVYLFACRQADAEMIGEEFNEPGVLSAGKFRPGEFYMLSRFADTQHGTLDFKRRSVSWQRMQNAKQRAA